MEGKTFNQAMEEALAKAKQVNMMPWEQEAIIAAEYNYERSLQKSTKVEEDELQDMNLGIESDPKVVKVSIYVEGQSKEDLQQLLVSPMVVYGAH